MRGRGLDPKDLYCILTSDYAPDPPEEVTYARLPTDLGKTEFMTDTTGYLQSKFNPCEHFKMLADFKPPSVGHVDVYGYVPFNFQYPNEGEGLTVPSLIPRLTELASPDLEWLDDFSAQAGHHFRTLVEEDMSLANAIAELIKFCEGMLLKLLALKAKFVQVMKMYLFLLAKYPEKPWLAFNFAIKPFFKDAITFIKSFRKAIKRLVWLLQRSGKDTFVQYRQDPLIEELDDMVFPLPEEALPWFYQIVPWQHGHAIPVYVKLSSIKKASTPCALGMINFDASHLAPDLASLQKVWLQSMGMFNPVKIGWEALPFSWMIDWFISKRTQLQLEAASVVQGLNNATVKQTSWSLKVIIEAEVTLCYGPTTVDPRRPEYEPVWWPYGSFQYTHYVRAPGLPEPEVGPFRVPLKWWNASILLALVSQHIRRGKGW